MFFALVDFEGESAEFHLAAIWEIVLEVIWTASQMILFRIV